MIHIKLDHKNFIENIYWSEIVKSGVKFKTICLCDSQSNQIDFYGNQKILNNKIETRESVLPNEVYWCFTEFGKTEFENIENWMSSFVLKWLVILMKMWLNLLY